MQDFKHPKKHCMFEAAFYEERNKKNEINK
jgi:hypothetical protein